MGFRLVRSQELIENLVLLGDLRDLLHSVLPRCHFVVLLVVVFGELELNEFLVGREIGDRGFFSI